MKAFGYITIMSCFSFFLAQGQVTMRVVTKTIEKSFHFKPGYEINIEGQNAEIVINTWEKDEIITKIEFESKHVDENTAKADVEKINYLASRVKNKIYLRNYISEKDGSPNSILSVRYHITLPPACPVYVKNQYGVVNLSNLSNRLKIKSAFTRIDLDEVSGLIDVNTRFGELFGQNLDAVTTIDSRRSAIDLYNVQGELTIRAHYGSVNVSASPLLSLLKLEAEMADVNLFTPNPQLVAYNISATGSEINLPSSFKAKMISTNNRELPQESRQLEFHPLEYVSLFNISINFSDLKIAPTKKVTKP